jgi:hypothetical protein
MTERQKEFIEGRNITPLLIFPEGTVSSGRHLLRFNKGAFNGLYPLKPVIIKSLNKEFDLSVGGSGLGVSCLRAMCYLWHDFEITQLPILEPTEYMFNNHYTEKTEKWEVYAEVVRDIFAELGDFKKSDGTLRDTFVYEDRLLGKKPREKEE